MAFIGKLFRRSAPLLTALFLLFALSSCSELEEGVEPSESASPSQSRPVETAATTPEDIFPIPEAELLDIPIIYEAGFSPYGSVWLDDHKVMIMTQGAHGENWEYGLFIYDTQTGNAWRTAEELDNFGWFGRRLNDGRVCFYDYDKIVILEGERGAVVEVFYFPTGINVAEMDVSPDGDRLVYTDLDNGNLYISGLDFTDARLIAESDETDAENFYSARPAEPKWSDDGKLIHYQLYDIDECTIKTVNPDDGEEDEFINPARSSYYPLPNDEYLLISQSGSISRYVLSDGSYTPLVPEDEYRPIAWDVWIKTAAAVVMDEVKYTDIFKIFDLENGVEIKSWEIGYYAPIYFEIDAFSPDGSRLFFMFTDDRGENLCYILGV